MKPLKLTGESMFINKVLSMIVRSDLLHSRSAGVCASDAPDRTAFHSNRSYGYAFRSKAARSNTSDAHPSVSFTQFPGLT